MHATTYQIFKIVKRKYVFHVCIRPPRIPVKYRQLQFYIFQLNICQGRNAIFAPFLIYKFLPKLLPISQFHSFSDLAPKTNIIAFYSTKLFISNADSLLGILLIHDVITMRRQRSTCEGSGQRQYSVYV
jgi:hypothetical protein